MVVRDEFEVPKFAKRDEEEGIVAVGELDMPAEGAKSEEIYILVDPMYIFSEIGRLRDS